MLIEEFESIFAARNLPPPPIEAGFPNRKAFLLEKLAWKNEVEAYGCLNVGATKEQIAKFVAGLAPNRIPDALLALYTRWNGETCAGSFKPEYRFLSVEGASEAAGTFRDLASEGYPLAHGQFLPIFSRGEADIGVFLCDLNMDLPVYYRAVWDLELGLLSPSLNSFFAFLLQANREGIYAKRRSAATDPMKYLPKEKALLAHMHPGTSLAPIRRVNGESVFDIFGRKSWPSSVPLAYEDGAFAL